MKSLDLLLFSGNKYWYSKIIEWFTWSKWSHVGFVMQGKDIAEIHSKFKKDMPHIDENKLYFWESGRESVRDSEDGEFKWGVQVIPLERKLEHYHGEVWIRKLKIELTDEQFEKLREVHIQIHDTPYDINIVDLIEAWLGIDVKGNGQHTDDFFCSAFVGYVYSQLGIMSKDIQWSLLQPKYFDSEQVDSFLNPIEPIKQTE